MSEISSLRVKRGFAKAKLTRLQNYFQGINNSDLNETIILQLKLRLSKFEPVLDEFDEIQREIEMIEPDDANERDIFETEYFELIANMHAVINKFDKNAVITEPSISHSVNTSNIKLPVIKLPVFKGRFDQWLEFRDAFSAMVHNNNLIGKHEKFYYLRSSLGDEALRVIQSIEVSDNNYDLAWKLLQERYENKSLIVFTHIKAIFELPAITKESYIELRRLFDDVTKHLRALENLKLPVEHWDTLIIYIMSTKFDPVSRRDWETFKFKGELPKMSDMNTFLRDKCSILEKLDNDKIESRVNNKFKNKTLTNVSVGGTNLRCYFCKSAHSIYNCEALLKLPVNTRIQQVKNKHLCVNCLRPGHIGQFCKLSGCKKCEKRHNTLLHVEVASESIKEQEASSSGESHHSISCCTKNIEAQVLLSTAIIDIKDAWGQYHSVRALLDCGSQSNFITTSLCEELGLSKTKVNFSVEGIGHALSNITYNARVNFTSRLSNYSSDINCLVIPLITSPLPLNSFDITQLEIPRNIKLADPTFNQQRSIDILLGSGIFWDLLSVGQIHLGKTMPVVQKTQLGWVIAGNLNSNIRINKTVSGHSVTKSLESDIDNQLTKFWQIEDCQRLQRHFSKEEQFCEDHFVKSYKRNTHGRFVVTIPMRDNIAKLGNSKELALDRYYRLERKLVKNKTLKLDYCKFMREYIELGHMSISNVSEPARLEYFIPHHAIVRESSLTTKLRVVFDASMKSDSGLSFNDAQYVGPTIQSDLVSILLRFREHRYVMTADISKMYRQILVTKEQRSLQKIFWRFNTTDEVKCYKLNTITYGTASAPYLATRCLHQLAIDNENINPTASQVIKNDFYMDDLLTGAHSVQEVVKLQHDLSSILTEAGFELRKWLSNHSGIIDLVQVNRDLEASILPIGEDLESKTLGILWNASRDTIQFSIKNVNGHNSVTKRIILSIISQIFDPLGLLGPVVVVAKIIMQRLWQAKLTWDEAVPQRIFSEWNHFYNSLYQLNELKIPRWIVTENVESIELHGFSDASETAYGACVYVRSKLSNNYYTTKLLTAKSRVAPIKQTTLPRLELCAAQLLAHLVDGVQSALRMRIERRYYWCDSMITLGWIRASSSRWKTFVANRVSDIQELTDPSDWYHINSKENPADILSRGIDASLLKGHKLWWNGPNWLAKNENSWGIIETSIKGTVELPEQRTVVSVCANIDESNCNIFDKCSDVVKLTSIVAFILRFSFNTKTSKQERKTGVLSTEELKYSRFRLIKLAQMQSYPDEYKKLQKKLPISKTSSLLSLNPYLDNNGLMRVNGRIGNSRCDFEKRFPIILPPRHVLTQLILVKEHKRLLHCGPQQLLYSIRDQFWLIGGRNATRAIVYKCIKCFRAKPETQSYIMGKLPEARVNQYLPFFNSGVDFAGPILIKDRKTRAAKFIKAYVCIFICLSTKAMHLEVVTDLSSDAFLGMLKRFIARRGKPTAIFSDNGTTFVGAYSKLKDLESFKSVIDELANDGITWHFIPPRAPNFGGLWEAGIKRIKYHLKRVVGNASLTYEDLCTTLAQIEAVLNSRPLTPLSSDPSDNNPLTPAHFLLGRSLTAIPEPSVMDLKESRLDKYQKLHQLIEHFWSRWHKEYLSELQTRTKWKGSTQPPLKEGTLVVVKEDNQPPLKWALGRITALHPGQDGIVRVVTVKLTGSVVKRAVNKVCVLPIKDNM